MVGFRTVRTITIGLCLVTFSAMWAAQPPVGGPARQRPRDPAVARSNNLPPGVKALCDMEYARVGEVSLKLDLYLPETDKPAPVVVWIHGGGWRSGDKTACPAVPLTARGYAVASINYRLTDVASWPAQIHDCKAAIRWLRAHASQYKLNPERVGAWGSSAGGHLVAMLGTSGGVKELEGDQGNQQHSSRVQAVCDWFGPSDLVAIHDLVKSAGGNGNAAGAVGKLLGGPLSENLEKARQASPVTWISKDDPSFLIMHGDQDRLVPLSQSTILHESLEKAGVDSTLYVVKGAGHGQGGFRTPEIQRRVAEFFDGCLKGNKAAATTRPE